MEPKTLLHRLRAPGKKGPPLAVLSFLVASYFKKAPRVGFTDLVGGLRFGFKVGGCVVYGFYKDILSEP